MPRTIKHTFKYYPSISFTGTQITSTPRLMPATELIGYQISFLDCIDPLLKHIEKTGHVDTILTSLSPGIGMDPWSFIDNIATIFPELIYAQLERTINATRGQEPGNVRRNSWIRKRLMKDLVKAQRLLKEFRERVIIHLVINEDTERDQRLLVLEHVLQMVAEEKFGKSCKTLIKMLK
ncbi:hypothetical protein RUND412_000179 [Rhizina undulata]